MNGTTSFEFRGCFELRESLGLHADSERHLMERIERVPAESIYYHTVRSLLRRQVVPTPYPDDFASWVAVDVQDRALAERLALPSPFDFESVDAFRGHLLEILDDHLRDLRYDPRSSQGTRFYFLRGHLTEVPLGVVANDLTSFTECVRTIEDSSIYYHMVESIGRLGRGRTDFAAWLDQGLGLAPLAARIDQIDPFVKSLSGVRSHLLGLLERELQQ
jgi:hypothetical protein